MKVFENPPPHIFNYSNRVALSYCVSSTSLKFVSSQHVFYRELLI